MASLSNATSGRRTGAKNRRLLLLLIPALALVGAFFLYPILDLTKASLFDPAFTTAHFVKFFTQKLYLRVSRNTIEIAFVTTLLCAAMGYPAAYFLAHSNAKRRPLLIFLILLPMWISVLIRSYAWMAVLGSEGLINTFLMATGLIAEPLSMLYTTGAVYLAMVQILLPIMILTCYGVMRDIEMDLIKAAHVLGAGKIPGLPLCLSSAEPQRPEERVDHHLHPVHGLLHHAGARRRPQGHDDRESHRLSDRQAGQLELRLGHRDRPADRHGLHSACDAGRAGWGRTLQARTE